MNFSLSPSYAFHNAFYHMSSFPQATAQISSTILERKTRKTITHTLESIHILQALNTGTCIQQVDLFYSAGLCKNWCWPQLTQEKLWRGFGKMQMNGPEG